MFTPGTTTLEDVRVATDRKGGRNAGFTRVSSVSGAESPWMPYPAIISGDGRIPDLNGAHVFKELGPGKNITPSGLDDLGLKNLWFFRPDFEPDTELQQPNNQKIYIIEPDRQCTKIVDVLDFSTLEIPWAGHRIGTAGPPHWRKTKEGDCEGIMMIHGMNKTDNGMGGDFYDYSLGAALIKRTKDGRVEITSVTRQPLLKASDFIIDGVNMAEQLHPNLRSAIYLVGDALINKKNSDGEEIKTLVLFVSVGDTSIIPVEVPLSNLVQNLRNQAIKHKFNL